MSPTRETQAEPAPAHDDAQRLVAGMLDLFSACSELLQSELALAKSSLRALFAAAIATPVLLLALWLSIIVLCVAMMHTLGLTWTAALASVVGVQLIGVAVLLRALRRWIGDLAMRRSRALIAGLLEVPK